MSVCPLENFELFPEVDILLSSLSQKVTGKRFVLCGDAVINSRTAYSELYMLEQNRLTHIIITTNWFHYLMEMLLGKL